MRRVGRRRNCNSRLLRNRFSKKEKRPRWHDERRRVTHPRLVPFEVSNHRCCCRSNAHHPVLIRTRLSSILRKSENPPPEERYRFPLFVYSTSTPQTSSSALFLLRLLSRSIHSSQSLTLPSFSPTPCASRAVALSACLGVTRIDRAPPSLRLLFSHLYALLLTASITRARSFSFRLDRLRSQSSPCTSLS